MNLLKIITLILTIFTLIFSNPPEHSVEFSGLLYRFSYSEEFDNEDNAWGQPRSDEYGATIGLGISYDYYNTKSNLTFGLKFNYSRSIKHTYDGSLQRQDLLFNDGTTVKYYAPYKIDSKDNFFYKGEVKIGYLINKRNERIIVEPKILWTMNGWKRPIGILEKYYWSHISPAISLSTKSHENLGILAEIGLLIPIWEQMITTNTIPKDKFDISGKIGWNFNLGFAKYLEYNRTIKIVYFYENYGFKESQKIMKSATNYVYEPSSSTYNHGIKILFEKGFSIERN